MNTTTHQTSRRNRAAYGVLELLKHLTVIVLSVLSVISAYAQTDFESAADAVANMKIGWNLGNSLDSHRNDITDVTQTETLRGQPKTREELMAMMRLAGFNAIRVPVTWYPHLDSSGNIDAAWLNRVQEVVDYVVGQGMYCIINVHHDTGNTDASGATNKGWLKADPDNYTQNHELFEKIWRQVATRFRDYGQLLIFEGFNEMLDIYDSRNFASFKGTNAYEPAVAINAYNSINNYNTAFVNTVRATGGNNTNRNLIIKTYGACEGRGDWSSHLIEPLTSLQLPEQAGHIIVGVHTYPPIINKETKDGITTITNRSPADIQADINIMFNNINTHITQRLGTPVIIGEWGTSEVDATQTDYDLRRPHMLTFVDIFVQLAKQNNIPAFYWMGLSDKSSRSLPAFNQADLATRMLKAYYGSDYQPTLLSENDYIDHVEFTKQYAEITLAESSTNLANTYSQIQIISSSENNYANPKIWLRVYKNSETKANEDNPISSTDHTSSLSTLADKVNGHIERITLVLREVGSNSLDIEHVYLIKADGEKTECTLTNRNACTITANPNYALVDVDESKYNTLYYGTKSLIVPAEVTASALRLENGTLISVRNYPAGHTIPKATGVLIHAQQSGLYKFDHSPITGTAVNGNRLFGFDKDQQPTTTSGRFYKLSNGINNDQPIGFYYGNANGTRFTSPAHRAYLHLPASSAGSLQFPMEYTIIDSVAVNEANFPDQNLRNFLSSEYTYQSGTVKPGNDNLLTPAELANIKTLDVSGKNIASLEGVKHLTALTSLNLSNNNVTTLDLSANKRLKTLNCANNNLTDLDLSANTNLTSLNYAGQKRNITAETAQTIVGYDTRNHPIYHKIYYLRLDDNTTGTGEHTIFQRLTAGNHNEAETSFTPERVLSWTGGEVIRGSRQLRTPATVRDIDPDLVYGDILLLTDATESGSEASGSVSYTYNVQNSFDTNGTRGNFTLNWVADATEGVVTRVDDITESAVVSTTYVDPLGRTSTRPFSGLNIVITRYSNGFTDQHKQLFP